MREGEKKGGREGENVGRERGMKETEGMEGKNKTKSFVGRDCKDPNDILHEVRGEKMKPSKIF